MQVSPGIKKCLAAAVIGIVVCLVALFVHWSDLLAIVELKSLDHRFRRYGNPAQASQDLMLVAIDEASLEAFGRWPWPRDRHGYVVHYLKQAGARAVVFDVLFLEPHADAEEFDGVFAEEVRTAGNVFLPLIMQDTTPSQANETAPATVSLSTTVLARTAVPLTGNPTLPNGAFRQYNGVKTPLPPLIDAARGLGFVDLFADSDGTTRRLPLVVQTHGVGLPQLALAVARDLLGADRVVRLPGALQLGTVRIPLTASGEMILHWYGTLEQHVYRAYSMGAVLQSYVDLQEGRVPLLDPAEFKDKIVFVGATAAGIYDLRVTPLSSYTPGVLVHMTALDNMLQRHFVRPAPYWMVVVTIVILCLGTAWSFMLLQRQTLKLAGIIGLGVGYYGLVVYAFSASGVWLELVIPEGALATTYLVVATVEYLTEGKQRRQLRNVFDKYMAPEVVDEILRHPENIHLGGEKQELSVFFSDVAGFTTISEQLTPEVLVEVLNVYLSTMAEVILQQRGNVNKYLGDGIMALFGAPRGESNHATLACYAALDCQQALVYWRQPWQARGFPELTTRIGVNSGALVVGNMGSQSRMEYTVMGDSVNLASRLEGANKFYDTRILLGPRTYELACNDIEAREVDVIRVKGKQEPAVVYELLARKGALSPEKRQLVEVFLAGLTAYKQRDFATAKCRFEAALCLDAADGPSREYVRRAQEYLESPPPPDWDGVYEPMSK